VGIGFDARAIIRYSKSRHGTPCVAIRVGAPGLKSPPRSQPRWIKCQEFEYFWPLCSEFYKRPSVANFTSDPLGD
jgi:hypothetical protein